MVYQRLFLIRHGERLDSSGIGSRTLYRTTCAPELKYDPPLTDIGIGQAQCVADYLIEKLAGVEHVLVVGSPYLRCVQTAVPFCQRTQRKLQLDPVLGEALAAASFPEHPTIVLEQEDTSKRDALLAQHGVPLDVLEWQPPCLDPGATRVAAMSFPEKSSASERRILNEIERLERWYRAKLHASGRTKQKDATDNKSAASGKRISRTGSIHTTGGVGDAQLPDFALVLFVHGFAVGSVLRTYRGNVGCSIKYTAMAELDLSTRSNRFSSVALQKARGLSNWNVVSGPTLDHLNSALPSQGGSSVAKPREAVGNELEEEDESYKDA